MNLLQHVKTFLIINGKCAIVVPDNVLFEGGAGEPVGKNLLAEGNVRTILRLPTGVFYAKGGRQMSYSSSGRKLAWRYGRGISLYPGAAVGAAKRLC